MNHEESILQQRCVACFRVQYPQYSMLLVHPINEGSGHAAIDRRRQGIHKAEGAVAGVSDLLLFMAAIYEYQDKTPGNDVDDYVRHIRYNGLGIEFKTKKGRQSQQQKDFQKMFEAAGYKYVVVRSDDEFRSVVNDYIAHTPKRVRQEIALEHVMITREAEEREREHFRKILGK